MIMNIERILALAIGSVALSGCATYGNVEGPYDPAAFGEANRQTYAAMVENPEPEYYGAMEGSAEKAADAVDRYRDDAVKEPDTISSTTTPGGG